MMESALDAAFQPNVALLTRELGGTQQFILGKPYGYTHASALLRAPGHALQMYLRDGSKAMSRAGQKDIMFVDNPPFTASVTRYVKQMRPPPRSILLKQPLACLKLPCAKHATEPPTLIDGCVVLSDPVHAPKAKSGDMDINGTIAAIVASAKQRKFFWVFLDHSMTAAPLEHVLDGLPRSIVAVNLDQGLRLFLNNTSSLHSAA
jgi:hypothetical protein